jgi:DNA primase
MTAENISVARSVQIESVIDQRGIKLRGRIERVGPCPICDGDDRFSINTKKLVFNCRGCNTGGDVIALVQHLDGCDFATACSTLAGPSRRLMAKSRRKRFASRRLNITTKAAWLLS